MNKTQINNILFKDTGIWIFKKYKLCKIFGHNWKYYLSSMDIPGTNLRYCKRCESLEKYRKNVPAYGNGWFRLVKRTKLGGKHFLEKLDSFN